MYYQKAFDTVYRLKLWTKLLSMGMAGKMIKVIKNMYSKAKSVVSDKGVTSSSFPCNIGVRQGENLSPLLFSIYLAYLKTFLAEQCTGVRYVNEDRKELLDRKINCFFLNHIH